MPTKATRSTQQAVTPAPRPSVTIVAEIGSLRSDLAKVQAVISIIGEPASAKADTLQSQIDAANNELATALANEMEQARQKQFASFDSIYVTAEYPARQEGNLLRAVFTIHYTCLQYDMRAGSVMKDHSARGFQALPDKALDYLIEARPDAIPPQIMELAPGEPREAFRRYFMGLRKGYLQTLPAAA